MRECRRSLSDRNAVYGWMDASDTLSRVYGPTTVNVKHSEGDRLSGCEWCVVHFRNACRVSVMDASDTLSRMIQPQSLPTTVNCLLIERGARCDAHEHHTAARTNVLERSACKRSSVHACSEKQRWCMNIRSIPVHCMKKCQGRRTVVGACTTRHASVKVDGGAYIMAWFVMG